jgi:hypothetical protein
VVAGPGSAPSSGGFEAVLFRGGMMADVWCYRLNVYRAEHWTLDTAICQ